MSISISAMILTNTQEEAIKAVETLSRMATGLAFEGLNTSISITPFDPEED